MTYYHFDFPGGELLNDMGASWFVSYIYYERIDKSHRNWERVKTASSRLSTYKKSRKYHRAWLQQVVRMSPDGLGTNTIGLSGPTVILMARDVLKWWDSDSLPEYTVKPMEKTPAELPEKKTADNISEEKNTTDGYWTLFVLVLFAFIMGVVFGKCIF